MFTQAHGFLIMKCFSLILGLLIVLTFRIGKSDDSTNLKQLIDMVSADPKKTMDMTRLNRHWVGEVKSRSGEIVGMRLEKASIRDGVIMLYRTDSRGAHAGSDSPVYRTTIPNDQKLAECRTIADLDKLLGESPLLFGGSAWGDGTNLHGTANRVCVGNFDGETLEYLSVFVSTIQKKEGDKWGERVINEFREMRRGKLRPENPDSEDEKRQFPTGDELSRQRDEKKSQERQRYPEPLRSLLAAGEAPGDSDLAVLKAAIEKIRNEPDPILFRQLVEEMHEGTLRIRMLLEEIVLDDPMILELREWEPAKREIAFQALVDAFPQVRKDELGTLASILLRMIGGGTIEFDDGTEKHRVTVTITKNGLQQSFGSAETAPSLEETRQEFLKRYRSLKR